MACMHEALVAASLAAATFIAAAEPLEDVDYIVIPAQPVAVPGKIEVIEFFYYGCDACNRLEAPLQTWLKTLAPDVSFHRIPALRRRAWMPLARVYFAFEQLGEIERLHLQVYRAVHEERMNLADSSDLYPWAEKYGITRVELERILESDQVTAQVQRARDATVAYGIRATPSFVVDGKYSTSGSMVGSLDNLLRVLDGLIDKARAAHGEK